MKRFCFILICGLLWTSLGSFTGAQDATGTRAKLKAMFIYQFATKIDWPKEYKSGSFVIGVYGNDDLYEELQRNHASKPAGSQPIKVVNYKASADIERCHILYVDRSKSAGIKSIAKKYKGKSMLIVSDEYDGGLDDGAVINFVVRNNSNKFELSKSNAQSYKLVISQYILNFAVNL